MRLFSLSPDDTEVAWPDFEPIFQQLETYGALTAEQVKRNSSDGKMQVWGLQDGDKVAFVIVTEILETASGLVCSITAAIGHASVAMQERLLDEIGKWARSLGCARVRLCGRKGWLRRFPRFMQTGIVAEWSLWRAH